MKQSDEDTQTISPEQDNEDKNIPHTPSSEDTIVLKSPAVQGEESVSGSDPDPASDDDMLENAHAVGEQQKEDLENPTEINIGRDINTAEETIRES